VTQVRGRSNSNQRSSGAMKPGIVEFQESKAAALHYLIRPCLNRLFIRNLPSCKKLSPASIGGAPVDARKSSHFAMAPTREPASHRKWSGSIKQKQLPGAPARIPDQSRFATEPTANSRDLTGSETIHSAEKTRRSVVKSRAPRKRILSDRGLNYFLRNTPDVSATLRTERSMP